MKVICSKKNLREAAVLTEKTTGHNPTFPILSSILISAQNKNLNFTSTNLEIGLEVSIPAKIEKEGKVAVPAKLFSSFVSSLSDDENIKLDVVNNNLLLTTKNTSTTIKCYNQEDFPLLPKIKKNKETVVSAKDFVLGLKSVSFASSLSEMKPEINSILIFSSKKNPLTFVATDSFRLAEKTIPYNFSDQFNFLIPYKSAVEILRVFENKDEDLKIILDDNNFVLESSYIKYISRLIEGVFPEYTQLIPTNFTNTVTIEKKHFIGALRTTSMFCGNLNEIKVKLYKEENFIEMQTTNPDLGEHTINAPCKTEGDDMSIVFNHRYLNDCHSSLNSEKIIMKFSGEGKPLLITGLDDNSFRYLIMPMKNV